MLKVVKDGAEGQADELALSLDDLAREGARRMLVTALEAEVQRTSSATGASVAKTGTRWWFATERHGRDR